MATIKINRIEQGVCPYCNSNNIEYGSFEIDGEGGYYEATCKDCGRRFNECYDFVFAGHYLNEARGLANFYCADNVSEDNQIEIEEK